jgi:glycosyltransferase involved in cell wall biosynthesis
MNLAIDITSVPLQPAGVGIYILNLARSLISIASQNGYKIFIFGRNNQSGMPEFQGAEFIACGMMSRAKRIIWEQAILPKILLHYKIALIHSPNYSIPVFAHCKKVCTIHDLTCLNFPMRRKFWHGFYFRNMIGMSARYSDFLLSDSENTRQDILRYFPKAHNKIRTVYPACNYIFNSPPEAIPDSNYIQLGLEPGYFLFVSTIEPSKNLERLINAFEMFKLKTHSNTSMVIVGKTGWNYKNILNKIKTSAAARYIKTLGYQTNETLFHLYKNALALVYPSLYEGFGIPPLEAMSLNIPVLAANASSIPEVVGGAALLFDPTDTHEMMLRMIEIYENKDLRKELAARGSKRVKLFSWNKSAQEIIAIYKTILTPSNPS